MSDYFLSGVTQTGDALCIAPITSEIAEAHNIGVSDSIGYYLYQKSATNRKRDIKILAKVRSEDEAFELARILGLS